MFRNVFVREHKLMSVSLPMKVEGLHNPSERRAGKPKWRGTSLRARSAGAC